MGYTLTGSIGRFVSAAYDIGIRRSKIAQFGEDAYEQA